MKTIEETYRDRLKMLISEYGSQNALAHVINKSATQISQWLNASPDSKTGRPRAIKSDTAREIEIATGKPYAWFDQPVELTQSSEKCDTVKIDVYDNVRFFAGDGNTTDAMLYKNGQNLETTTLQFPVADFLRSGADPEQSVCVKLSGDSMSPLIPDGATIGIDKSKTQAKDGSIHAFWHGGMLRVKELQILPNNKVRIKSYNPKYDDECASIDELIIVGRVFWWSVLIML